MQNDNKIQIELKELNSMLAGVPKRNVYTVPDGYFDSISYDVLLGLKQAPLHLVNASVPEGYFANLADVIMNKIKAETIDNEDEAISFLPVKAVNPYTVPAGYFERFAEEVVAIIGAEVPSSILPAKAVNPYTVPAGYFEGLSNNIASKLSQPAKVISMGKRSMFRYAAAAVITGVLGLSVISIFDKKETGTIAPSTSEVMAQANEIITKNSFDKELATISDADIVNYLEKSGEDVNAALVASVADDKNLPDQVDYLTDDNTLDNLLNELKLDESTNN